METLIISVIIVTVIFASMGKKPKAKKDFSKSKDERADKDGKDEKGKEGKEGKK